MNRLLKILLLLTFCASASADNYRIVGMARLTGFDVLAKKLTVLAQQAAPEAKALPAIMVAAMSFNPDFAAFDLTDPVLVNYYIQTAAPNQPPRSEPPLWCLVVSISGDGGGQTPDQIKFMGKFASVRIIGNKALISWSKPLLDSITTIPPDRNTEHDLYLWLNSGEYCRNLPADLRQSKDYLLREIMVPVSDNVDPAAAQSLQLRLEYLEKILRQSGETEVFIDLMPDRMRIHARIVPDKGSPLGEFIAVQQGKTGTMPPVAIAPVSIAANFVPYAPAISGINDFCAALSNWKKTKEYQPAAEFFRKVFAACNGQGVMTVTPDPKGGEQIYAWVGQQSATPPTMKEFVGDVKSGIYRISPAGARRNIFVRPVPRDVSILAGSVDSPATAAAMIVKAQQAKATPMSADKTVFLVGTWRNLAGENALDIIGRSPASALEFSGDIRIPLLKVIFPRLVNSIGAAASPKDSGK